MRAHDLHWMHQLTRHLRNEGKFAYAVGQLGLLLAEHPQHMAAQHDLQGLERNQRISRMADTP